jgi:hypothetical protein
MLQPSISSISFGCPQAGDSKIVFRLIGSVKEAAANRLPEQLKRE